MNDVLKAIENRRSIRHFKNKPISSEILHEILNSGFYAPTAHNMQPWHFIVIEDKEKLEKIMQNHPYTNMLKTAPVAILVCADTVLSSDFWADDCAAATQNMLLSAYSLGIGSCWCGVYPKSKLIEAMSEIFDLPTYIKPYSLISLGYSEQEKEKPERFNEKNVHKNQW